MVETLIYHGKLANQIARLAAIVVKFFFVSENNDNRQQNNLIKGANKIVVVQPPLGVFIPFSSMQPNGGEDKEVTN